MRSPAALQFAVLLVLLLAVFVPVFPGLVEAWSENSNNSHGMLVPFIALFFAWRARDRWAEIELRGSAWGGVLLAASLAVYLLSLAGGVVFGTRIMLVFALAGLILFTRGKQALRLLAFPLLLLVFMVPVPVSVEGMVSFPLQQLATVISAEIIHFFSIPVYREGNMLFFLQTELEVAEACSGIRSIVSLTMLGVIFAYLSEAGWKRKVILVLSAIPIAMLANIIRVSGTGILAHFFGDRVARGFLHEFSGLAVFAFGLAVLYLEFSLLTRSGGEKGGNEGKLSRKHEGTNR